jgi:hypothetical protein
MNETGACPSSASTNRNASEMTWHDVFGTHDRPADVVLVAVDATRVVEMRAL